MKSGILLTNQTSGISHAHTLMGTKIGKEKYI